MWDYLLSLLVCSVPVILFMQFKLFISGFSSNDFGIRVEPVYELKDLKRFKSESRNLLSPTGSIFWIPQLYINYKLRSLHMSVRTLSISETFFFIAQIICILFFLNIGMFWLIAANHPVAIVGHLIFDLVHLPLIYQSINYDLLESTSVERGDPMKLGLELEYESRS